MAIRTRARRENLTVSELLRRQALAPSGGAGVVALQRCAKTGAMIFAPQRELPRLTVETTRDLLAEFP